MHDDRSPFFSTPAARFYGLLALHATGVDGSSAVTRDLTSGTGGGSESSIRGITRGNGDGGGGGEERKGKGKGKEKEKGKGRYHHLLAGSLGGLVSSGLLQPFDVIKTRVQQSGRRGPGKETRSGTLGSVVRATIGTTGSLQVRVGRLWRGAVPSVVRSSVGSGLYFVTLNEMRTRLQVLSKPVSSTSLNSPSRDSASDSSSATSTLFSSPSGPASGSPFAGTVVSDNENGVRVGKSSKLPVLSGQLNLLTGATARAAVGFVMMPITIIKVRYESDLYAYKSMHHAARQIYSTHGLRGFFYGFGATAIRDAPYAGLYVYVYELSKMYLSSLMPERATQLSTLGVNFGSGLVAGFGATLLTNPFDVMRTRMQLRPALYKNVWTAARRMYIEEGPRSFLDGVGIRIARKSISSAFTWSLYEFVLASI